MARIVGRGQNKLETAPLINLLKKDVFQSSETARKTFGALKMVDYCCCTSHAKIFQAL